MEEVSDSLSHDSSATERGNGNTDPIIIRKFSKLSVAGDQVIECEIDWSKCNNNNTNQTFPSQVWTYTHLQKLTIVEFPGTEIPSGIGNLLELTELTLTECDFDKFPTEFARLKKLETLEIVGGFESDEDDCTAIPSGVGLLENLTVLRFIHKFGYWELPCDLNKLTKLKEIQWEGPIEPMFPTIFSLKSLTHARIKHRSGGDDIYQRPLIVFPDSMSRMGNLQVLELSEVTLVAPLDEYLDKLSTLRYLSLHGCDTFDSPFIQFPASICSLQCLEFFELRSLRLSTPLPQDWSELVNLKDLAIDRCSTSGGPWIELPTSIWELQGLQELTIQGLKLLTSLPEDMGKLSNLTCLVVTECDTADGLPVSLPPSIGQLADLKELNLIPNQTQDKARLPKAIGRLSQLEKLCVFDHHDVHDEIGNLFKLKALTLMGSTYSRSAIKKLSNLESLTVEISRCDYRKSMLPFLPRLKALSINDSCIGDPYMTCFADLFEDKAWKNEPSSLERLSITFARSGNKNVLMGLPRTLRFLEVVGRRPFWLHELQTASLPEELNSITVWTNCDLDEVSPGLVSEQVGKLLVKYDQLRSIQVGKEGEPALSLPYYETYLLKFNQCGRALLRTGSVKPIPLSLWPLVLATVLDKTREKPTKKEKVLEMEASILLQLLQGQELLGHLCDIRETRETGALKRKATNDPEIII